LLGFVKWQLGIRMIPGSVVFEWVGGARTVIQRGDTGMTQNIYCGLQDFGDMAYVLHATTPQDLFVDVGANLGGYTILACAARGARGYCVEPVPATYRRLLDNIAINNLSSRVVTLNIGLSNRDGELNFTAGDGCYNRVIANGEPNADCITVPVRTLDSVLSGESPSMMKIDVEGFETPILDGAEATLGNASLHSVIMELNGFGARYGFDDERIVRRMRDYGFSTYQYEPFSRQLLPIAGKSQSGDNTLFVRNENLVRERIAGAPRVVIGSGEF
jgi:FkbM family methyltransferase